MQRIFILLICTFFYNSSKSQTLEEAIEFDRENTAIRVVFYNVENLFDTIADAGIQDEEFLPESEKAWNTIKYRIKISNIAKTLRAVGGWSPPEIIGLAEIENRSVMLDLVNHMSLEAGSYNVLHFDSDDPRGIDVGLCYNRDLIEVLYAEPIKMRFENVRTRDILYAKLLINKEDTLHMFINHWPSRRGGQEASAPKRIVAAEVAKQVVDSIAETTANANILLMGDFNDTPRDSSLHVLTKSKTYPVINLMEELPPMEGSHKYRGIWDYLDQLLVSGPMLNGSQGMRVVHGRAYVFSAEFLLERDDRYGDYYPYRSWKGPSFTAGYSDHLPVFVDVKFK